MGDRWLRRQCHHATPQCTLRADARRSRRASSHALKSRFLKSIAASTPGFVALCGTDQNNGVIFTCRAPIHHSVGVAGRRTALHADCAKLDHLVCDCEKRWHRTEWFASKILV